MKKQPRKPYHGEWYVEDQTRTENGYALLRYCGVLPYVGWHRFGNFESRDAAIAWWARDYKDTLSNGSPWPEEVRV
jgi:hypothetical protein